MLKKSITILFLLMFIPNNLLAEVVKLPTDDENRIIIICDAECQRLYAGGGGMSFSFNSYLSQIVMGQLRRNQYFADFRISFANGNYQFGRYRKGFGSWYTDGQGEPINFGEPIN